MEKRKGNTSGQVQYGKRKGKPSTATKQTQKSV